MQNNLTVDFRRLESLRRRLQSLEERLAAFPDRSGFEARQIEAALACARASLELAYGSLPPPTLTGGEGERSH